MPFTSSLAPYITRFLNEQEFDQNRRTWIANPRNKYIYFYRDSWWINYRMPSRKRQYERPIFYFVIGNFRDSPIEIKCAARFDHTLLNRDNCPNIPTEVIQFFNQHGVEQIPDETFTPEEPNIATDIGFKRIPLPMTLLANDDNGNRILNIDASVDANFAYKIICSFFINNPPVLNFLEFLRENNI